MLTVSAAVRRVGIRTADRVTVLDAHRVDVTGFVVVLILDVHDAVPADGHTEVRALPHAARCSSTDSLVSLVCDQAHSPRDALLTDHVDCSFIGVERLYKCSTLSQTTQSASTGRVVKSDSSQYFDRVVFNNNKKKYVLISLVCECNARRKLYEPLSVATRISEIRSCRCGNSWTWSPTHR